MLRFSSVLLSIVIAAQVAYCVDWTRVPSIVPEPRNLNTPSLGECACDLHVDACDDECCCDPDCDLVSGGTGVFKECLPPRNLNHSYACFQSTSATTVFRKNNGANLEVSLDVEDPGDQFVCVYRNNFPDRLSYYAVPSLPVSTSSSDGSDEWFSSADVLAFPGFQAEDNVPIHTVEKSGLEYMLRRSAKRTLGVQGRGPAGVCEGTVPVPFMGTVGVRACFPKSSGVSGAELCAANAVPSAIRAIVRPNSPLTTVTEVVPVTLAIFDAATGMALPTLSDDASAIEVLDPTSYFVKAFAGTTDTDSIAQADVLAYSTYYDNTSDTCVNAAVAILTAVFYSTTRGQDYATVINATSFVFVKNLTTAELAATTLRDTVMYVNSTLQEAGPRYSTPKATAADGSTYPISFDVAFGVENLARSGNPGYAKGQRVLAGVLLTNGSQQVVTQRLTGLSHPIGSCSSGPMISVPFGHNVEASSCYVPLTEAELQAMCTVSTYAEGDMTGAAHTLLTVLNRSTTDSSAGLVDVIGVTGDAADAVISSWVAVENGGAQWAVTSGGTSPLPYSSTERTCSNIVTGLRYTLSIGRAGSPLDPQDIIVGARVDPIYGSWVFKGTQSTHNFRYSLSVVFDRYVSDSEKTQQRRIIAPSVLPGVDEYVFYPFRRPRT